MANDNTATAGKATDATPGVGQSGLASDDDICLPARKVRERYDVSDMTLWRWINDPKLAFPHPFYIGRLRYWKLSALLGWEREREASAT